MYPLEEPPAFQQYMHPIDAMMVGGGQGSGEEDEQSMDQDQ